MGAASHECREAAGRVSEPAILVGLLISHGFDDPLGGPVEAPAAPRLVWARAELVRRPLGYSDGMAEQTPIVVVDRRIAPGELARLTALFFEDMVKYVVDLERRLAAVGGELHADAEALLLDAGSNQRHLWGANYYPGQGEDGCIEYTSLINIRPAQGNRSMEVEDPGVREGIRELTFELIGHGEPLP